MTPNPILIAPKPFSEYEAGEYHSYVSGMWQLRVKKGAKPPSPAPGLSVSHTKKGALTIRRTKVRPFAYVTWPEIAALAKAAQCMQSDLWNAFKAKEFIVTQTRMEAERLYSDSKGLPW